MFNPKNAIVKLSEFVSHRIMSKVNCSHAWERPNSSRDWRDLCCNLTKLDDECRFMCWYWKK